MQRLTTLALTLGVAAMVGSCGPRYAKHDPVPLTMSTCCKEASEDLQSAKGCRINTDRCRGEEKIWMRGQITCGPVDPEQCMGARCCEYHQQPDPNPDPDPEPDPEPEPKPEPEPDPEPDAEPEP